MLREASVLLIAAVALVSACDSNGPRGGGGAAGSSSPGDGGGRPSGGSSNPSTGGQAQPASGGAKNTGGMAGDGASSGGHAGVPDAGGGLGDAGRDSETGGGPDGDRTSREFLYVANESLGLLSFAIDPTNGALTELGSPLDPAGRLTALAVAPTQDFVYVANFSGKRVDTYRIRDDGSLELASTIQTPTNLLTLALHPSGRFVYAGGEDLDFSGDLPGIHTFAVDAAGKLSVVGDLKHPTPVGGGAPTSVAVHPNGAFLYATEALVGVRGYSIDAATGALTGELDGFPVTVADFPPGTILGSGTEEGPMVLTPSGDFLYMSTWPFGLQQAPGELNGFDVDGTTGALTFVDGSPFSVDVGSGTSSPSVAITPEGEQLYVTRYLGTKHISSFAIGTHGVLTELPGSPITGEDPIALAIDPTGRFVYVGNEASGISVYLRRSDGSLTLKSKFERDLTPTFAFATLP